MAGQRAGPPTVTRPPAAAARLAGVASSMVRDLLALTEQPGVISFAGGLPAPELFDVVGIREALDAALSRAPGRSLQYSPSEGNADLRELLADRYRALGVPTAAGDILVTTGSQQALTLFATALVDPGDVVLVESPSYLAALQCFGLAGARIVPVPTAGIGIDLTALEQLAGLHHPKVCYTVPTFQNPTGRTLDGGQRRELVSLAERYGFWLIEDDPYRELRYSGSPQPPLARFAPHDHVLSTGSLSKIIAPGLRIGWVRTPPVLKPALVVIKQAADLHTSTIDQAAAAHYLASGRLPGHLDVMRAEYARRRDALLAALPAALPAGSHWNSPDGGMFVWVVLPEGYDAMERLPAAIGRQVAFVPGAEFYPTDPLSNTMRLSFTTYPADRIAEGVRRLGLAFGAEHTQ